MAATASDFWSGSSPAGKSPIASTRAKQGLYQFAQRFAAKEAFSKALGVGLRQGGIRWRDVEVLPNPRGKPEIQVTGRAAELCRELGISAMHLSLTDEDNFAVAMVVLET